MLMGNLNEETLINRQAAIDAFERFIHELGIKDEPYNYGEMALSIRNVPPVTPQQKKGYWIETTITEVGGGDFKRGFKCSKCNYVVVPNGLNFCPHCGAKMQEVEE